MESDTIIFSVSLIALGALVGRYLLSIPAELAARRAAEKRLASSEKAKEGAGAGLEGLAREQEVPKRLLIVLPVTAAQLTECRSQEDVARVVGEAAADLLEAREVAVLIRDHEFLRPIWTKSDDTKKPLDRPIRIPTGRLGELLKSGLVLSAEELPSGSHLPWSAAMWAPIRHRGELRGVIHVAHMLGRGKEAQRLLTVLGHMADSSFKTIELFDEQASSSKSLEVKVHERTVELRKAYEELKELDHAKDEFISSVSHELRTPLTSIRSFSELLLTFDDDDKQRREEFLTIINDESKRLTRLIDDVLDIAKIESGQTEWRLQKIDIADLVGNTVELQKPSAEEKKLRLRVESTGLQLVVADRDRIKQVMMNLLSNAVKFSPLGSEVMVSSMIDGPDVVVTIADQGAGVPRNARERIFMRFQQLGETNTGKTPGTGLGLAICKEIISRHGGKIWVEDNMPRGSKFSFSLPALPDADTETI